AVVQEQHAVRRDQVREAVPAQVGHGERAREEQARGVEREVPGAVVEVRAAAEECVAIAVEIEVDEVDAQTRVTPTAQRPRMEASGSVVEPQRRLACEAGQRIAAAEEEI